MKCRLCNEPFNLDSPMLGLVVYCGHSYHLKCSQHILENHALEDFA